MESCGYGSGLQGCGHAGSNPTRVTTGGVATAAAPFGVALLIRRSIVASITYVGLVVVW